MQDCHNDVADDAGDCPAAALLTPNARQNVVTVRRRSGPNGRASGLISPQPLNAAKRLRMEVRPAAPPRTAVQKLPDQARWPRCLLGMSYGCAQQQGSQDHRLPCL